MRAKYALKALVCGAAITGLAGLARADHVTAFGLIKEGDRYVGEGVKDQVVQIRSEKSIGGLTPDIWYVVYYDEHATFKAVEVKFEGGKKVAVKRPARVLELASRTSDVLDHKKMNVDSGEVLSTATGDSSLSNLKVTASQMWLQHSEDGPVWKVRVW